MSIRILIVDDHPLFVEALKLVINGTFSEAAGSEATSIEAARGVLDKQVGFDLGVGETTVKARVSEILRKLKVASRTRAAIGASKIDVDFILGAPPDQDPSS